MHVLKTKKTVKYNRMQALFFCMLALLLVQGCTSVATFPTVARAGDTVSLMVGGTEDARKDTVQVSLTDVNGQVWDLQALGLVRSVFNLRADGRAKGTHYSAYLENYFSWSEGHEPVQTVLVVDVPTDVAVGAATLDIDTQVKDDSSGIGLPYSVNLDVIAGTGSTDAILRRNPTGPPSSLDFSRLEPAPHAKISFGISDGIVIGAASLVVDFDETVVSPGDINVYAPESTVRGDVLDTGAFGEAQRMIYWHQDGTKMFIDVVAPQGIKQAFLMMFLVHPVGLSASPNFNIVSSNIYDTAGNEIALTPLLEYFP